MTLFLGAAESLLFLGCARWAWRRCTRSGARDSDAWPLLSSSSSSEFSPVPRACRAVLAAYEDDLARPRWAPSPAGYRMDPTGVVKRVPYADTRDRCPPYILYVDRGDKELVVAVRGLNLVRNGDYRVLLDSGIREFDGGYVHGGLLKAAVWVLNREADTIARLLRECGEEYRLVFAGHSLGAGVAAVMAAVAVNYLDRFGGIERGRVRCYALAPARCMSMNLAVKYADVIHSVVLQDDFLPRTPTPLEHIFGSIFCLPCLIGCIRDTFIDEERTLKDPKRLYAPGRMYHIIDRKSCCCGRTPPQVRAGIPVEGRFEHIVLSCSATSDHSLVWIEREAQRAFDRMMENTEVVIAPPTYQNMEKNASIFDIPNAVETTGEPFEEDDPNLENDEISSCSESKSSRGRSEWDELVENLFHEEEPDDLDHELVLKDDINPKL